MDKNFKEEIETLIKANVHVINVISFEWQRVHAMLDEISSKLEVPFYVWSSSFGIRKMDENGNPLPGKSDELKDPINLLSDFFDSKNFKNGILLLEDFHPYMERNNPEVIRWIKEYNRLSSESAKYIIIMTPIMTIPLELEKEVPAVEIPLPDSGVIKQVLQSVVDEYNLDERIGEVDFHPDVLDAALGLTTMEAKRAFSKAAVEDKRITVAEVPKIIDEKEQIIRKGQLLEYYHPDSNFDAIGGMDNLKEWLLKRGKGFGEEARKYGLESPRGVLLLGVQGCGKSLTAKAIAQEWKLPLLKFDLGRVYGSLVGQSEANIRNALQIAEALAPCVLWIDEIEKGLSGLGSSDTTDGGTTSRVFGTILTWMQEKQKPVFVIATANDISMLPPELLRKGRFDEIFFVDLPNKKERETIFKIHIKKKATKKNGLKVEELANLAKESVGYSGAEIEEIVKEALYIAYNDDARPVTYKDMTIATQSIVALSSTMPEIISDLRKWAESRTRRASSNEPEELARRKTDIPQLRQDQRNPFIKPKER